jgi:hypothetical protein
MVAQSSTQVRLVISRKQSGLIPQIKQNEDADCLYRSVRQLFEQIENRTVSACPQCLATLEYPHHVGTVTGTHIVLTGFIPEILALPCVHTHEPYPIKTGENQI